MRCNNCGWDNSASALKCEKCNVHLRGSMVQNAEIEQKRNDNPVRGTLPGADSELPYIDQPNQNYGGKQENNSKQSEAIGTIPCPICGYPKFTDDGCPNLKNHPAQKAGNKEVRKTVNSYDIRTSNQITLRPIPRQNERPFNEIVFSGEEIKLNRDNLESQNQTITSKIQATITYQNGKWYLVDNSDLKSTYIQVTKPVELKTGDIILMGDRKFEFNA